MPEIAAQGMFGELEIPVLSNFLLGIDVCCFEIEGCTSTSVIVVMTVC